MPINICSLTPYSLNYGSLENYLLNEFPVFFDSALNQKKYFSHWISLLKMCDTQNTDYWNSLDNKRSLIANIINEPELYQQELSVGDNIIYLHYRVSFIKSLLMQVDTSKATQVDINEFTSEPPLIQWVYPTDFNKNYPLNLQPVVAIEYPFSHANYLIIDGNHRIAKHISCKHSSLPVFFLDAKQVTQHKLLAMSFDLIFYLFEHDVYNLGYLKDVKHLSDVQLLSHSTYSLAQQYALGIL